MRTRTLLRQRLNKSLDFGDGFPHAGFGTLKHDNGPDIRAVFIFKWFAYVGDLGRHDGVNGPGWGVKV